MAGQTTRAGAASSRARPRDSGSKNGSNETRWQEILDAAAEVFFEKGYAGTSIQDIADRVGLLKGSLYHYIKTKEDLLFGIIYDVQKSGIAVLEAAAEVPGDARTRTREFIRAYTVFTIKTRVRASVFDRDFHSLTGKRRQLIVKERDVYDTFLRTLIADGIEEGVFSSNVNPVVLGNVIFQMVNSIYHWYSEKGRMSAENIAEQIADFAIGGLERAGL